MIVLATPPPAGAGVGSKLADPLIGVTIVYLAVPPLIFLGTWVRPLYGVPVAALLVAGGLSAMHHLRGAASGLSGGDLLRACLPATVIALLCGAGGIGFQDSDWLKHDALLADLIGERWPVVYDGERGPLLLTYYLAWYLPAALIGKAAGWAAANWTLALYTAGGFCLAGLWVVRLCGVRRWWVVVLFFAFAGMDVVGQVLREIKTAAPAGLAGRWDHIEWWAGLGTAQYSGMTTLAMWVPNQAIAGWLLTALVVASAAAGRLLQTGPLYLGISILWAPFVTIGLLPFFCVLGLLRARPREVLPGIRSTANLAGLVVGLISVVYLAARWSHYELPADVAELYTAGLSVRSDPGFLMLRYPLFVVLEFLVLHALLYRSLMLQPASGRSLVLPLLLVASASLLVLPLIRYGFHNDLVMRASIPALFVTVVVTIAVLGGGRVTGALRGAILLVLAIGSVTTLIELQRHVRAIYLRGSLIAVPAPEEPPAMLDLQRQRYAGVYNFLGQYVGGTSSPYMRHLAPTASEPAAGKAAAR